MKKTWLSALVVLLIIPAGCASLLWMGEKPSVEIVSVVPKEMRLLEQTFLLELRIQNPSETELDINGMAFELEINGQTFAKGVSNKSVKVERLSTKVVEVEAYTGLISILRQLSEVRKGSYSSGFTYRLKGSLYAGSPSIRIPFDETGEFK